MYCHDFTVTLFEFNLHVPFPAPDLSMYCVFRRRSDNNNSHETVRTAEF